ncbi:uncharacterized protein [Choristoneura fumiferana]|uniref:uncharacterized protein n=1 Tax=Choristoneura fumiferana TaxID=7141 RepID=UPI003D1581DC
MEEEDTKLCTNCKREIPSVNFTTHSVHCARNLRNCPVCKEPVPLAQLQAHHDTLHKEVPCKKCGESVCGTDLEDHIRDSCAQTIKPCRFCELELPRRSLPAHESYCGARSEQCPDCREYVMAKYKQLHLDSNHGFIRLDDDPTPKEEKPKPKPIPKPIPKSISMPITNGLPAPSTSNGITSNLRPATEIRHYEPQGSREDRVEIPRTKITAKRTNDQPQINTNVQAAEKVTKELPSRGAVKKRPAPPPPSPPPDPARDRAYYSAAARAQREENQRQQQSAYNLSVGLPPVLSPAAKLDKLRKMDALHNRETEQVDYKNKLQGRVWMPPDVPVGNVLGSDGVSDLSHLQPMTAAQFMDRFQELQLGSGRRRNGTGGRQGAAERGRQGTDASEDGRQGVGARDGDRQERGGREARGDRFSEIKTSLQELRRGLNEVTAPYNASNAAINTHIDNSAAAAVGGDEEAGLQLPCEFCGCPVPADDLVLHQTGCRPDLAQYQPPAGAAGGGEVAGERARAAADPVIPCEFCPQTLPVYLISEHQERCRREANVLFPD